MNLDWIFFQARDVVSIAGIKYAFHLLHVWYGGTCLVLWYMFGTVVHVWYCGTCMALWYMFNISLCMWRMLVWIKHSFMNADGDSPLYTRVQTWAAEEPVEPKNNFYCLRLIHILSGNAKNYTQRCESEYFLIYQRRAQNQPRSIVGTSFVGADTNEYRLEIMSLIKYLYSLIIIS